MEEQLERIEHYCKELAETSKKQNQKLTLLIIADVVQLAREVRKKVKK